MPLGHPQLRSRPQEGTRGGAVLLPGILGVGLCMGADGAWISWVLAPTPPQREGSSPRPARVCILHRNLCGCFSKNVNGEAPCLFGDGGSDP